MQSSGPRPLLNFNLSSDGHAAVIVGHNDFAYRSKVQNWKKFQTVTPSETTPYVNLYWTVKEN